VITPVFRRLSMPVAVLVGGILLSGCTGSDNIPLKKVDFVLDAPPKDFKETRREYTKKGASSKIGRDPSGIAK
jgi:di/tripeptidase